MSPLRYAAALAALLVSANACLVEIRDLAAGGAPSGGGSQGGAGAEGGETSAGGAGGSGASAPCPEDMVHVTHAAFPDVSFCIDRTEVRRSDYVAFLAAVNGDVSRTEQPPECAFNTALTVSGLGSACPTFSGGSDGELPVNCIDWCDAYAYCAYQGKRLCGALSDGGVLPMSAAVTSDEWHFACSHGFEQAYPYGSQGQICACFIAEEWGEAMMCDYEGITSYNIKAPVGTHPDCEGGYPGIFDMQGNVAEWTARCEPGTGTGDERCSIRGGGTYSLSGSTWYRCDNLAQSSPRNDTSTEAGIRCCADARP